MSVPMTSETPELSRTFPTLSPGYWSLDALLSWHEHATRVRQEADHPARTFLSGHELLGRVVTAELELRGVRTGELAPFAPPATWSWPPIPEGALTTEWSARQSEANGRIPCVERATDLWAQHKYSMMARSPQRGREIGARLGAQDPTLTCETLLPELAAMLRTPPREGTLRDAVMHMWGYVSPIARARGVSADFADVPKTVTRIAEIALEDPTSYLANSTALAELDVASAGAKPPLHRIAYRHRV